MKWSTISRRTVLDRGKYLKVEDHVVRLPDGRVIDPWPWVVTPDYVNVVAVTEGGRILCFRQPKYGIDGTSLAPIGGYIEPGEAPMDAAKRELLEETGFDATDWQSFGEFRVDSNRGAGIAYFFLARGAKQVRDARSDDLEEQQLLFLRVPEVEAALQEGEFKVLAWAAAIALALRILQHKS
jgi:ADP-ribose pyrophosphatase